MNSDECVTNLQKDLDSAFKWTHPTGCAVAVNGWMIMSASIPTQITTCRYCLLGSAVGGGGEGRKERGWDTFIDDYWTMKLNCFILFCVCLLSFGKYLLHSSFFRLKATFGCCFKIRWIMLKILKRPLIVWFSSGTQLALKYNLNLKIVKISFQ